jgi:DNA-binding XRE family transcriptional regulator
MWDALENRLTHYKRNHAGERLPDRFPDLAERRTVAGLSRGALAAKACLSVRQIIRIEADPTQRLDPSLVLRLRLVLGMLREKAGNSPDPGPAATEQGQEGA